MSKYSSVFFGQKSYYDIAPFRFPIYKDLVAGEAEGIEEIGRRQAKNTYALLKIARELAVQRGISVQESLDLLSDVNQNQEVLLEYVDQLSEIQTEGQSISEQKIQTVTLFIKYRGELKEKRMWVTLADWQEDDTKAMPNRMLDQIYEFVDWERNGWPEEQDDDDLEGPQGN